MKNSTDPVRIKLMINNKSSHSDEIYRIFFENTGTAMIIIEDNMTISLVNNEFENMTGYSKLETEGIMKWTQLVHADDLATMQDYHALRRYNPGFAPRSYVFRYHHKNGSICSAILTTTVIPDSSQSIASMIDISEKTRTEEQLRLNNQLLDMTSDAIFLNDLSGNFIYVNKACSALTGYERDELLHMNARDFDVSPGNGVLQTHLRETLKKGELTLETRGRRKKGPNFYMEVNSRIIEVAGAKYVFNTAHDITARKKAEIELHKSYEKMQATLNGIIGTIATMSETRDPYTAGHQRQVSRLAHAMANEMQLDESTCDSIRIAGILHDIGKLSIPAEILSKPGKLSYAEFEIIKRHPAVGSDILKTIEFPWPLSDIVMQHHERLDGSGYPVGLTGDTICLEARILAVADVVEAMASHRPYRPALGIKTALEEVVKHSGSKYDTDAVNACVSLINEKGFSLY